MEVIRMTDYRFMTSANHRKHQRAINKVFRAVNKSICDDELWLGRFAVVQCHTVFYTEKMEERYIGNNCPECGVALVFYQFVDKKTGRRSQTYYSNTNDILNHPNKIYYRMNIFIIKDCHPDVWGAEVKPSIENAEDFRKVGVK